MYGDIYVEKGFINNMSELEIDSLNSAYSELLKALNGDETALINIFEKMSGQQVNLPVHLYDADSIKKKLKAKAKYTTIDVNEESIRYGYSRRWIRNAIKKGS